MLDKNFCQRRYRADSNLKYFLKYVVTDFKLVWNEDKMNKSIFVDFLKIGCLTSKKIISSSILMN